MLRSQQTMYQLWGKNSEKNIMSVDITSLRACPVIVKHVTC